MANTHVEEQYLRCILLKDVEGERALSGLGNTAKKYLLGVEKREGLKVLRGELVSQIMPLERIDRKPPHNYGLINDFNVTFYTHEDDVSPLDITDFQLLAAIESPYDRFATFATIDKLEWGVRLRKGSEVFVRLPGPVSNPVNAEWSRARIEYKGGLKGLPGMMFGVEIMEARYRGRGSTDGWFQDRYVFQCKENCGLFVPLDKLASQSPINQQPSYADISRRHQESHDKLGTSGDVPLAEYDRVVAYSKKGIPIHGTVRWIGNKIHTRRELGATYVGIETDVIVYSKEFECALSGIPDLFQAKRHHQLVLPLGLVIKDDSQKPSLQNQRPNPNRERHTDDDPHRAAPQGDRMPNTTTRARDLGMSVQELMSEQERLVKEVERVKHAKLKAKKGQSYEETEVAMQRESITVNDQQKILDQIKQESKNKKKDSHGANMTPPQPHDGIIAPISPTKTLGLEVGTSIQIESLHPSQPLTYGVIKWIGELPGVQGEQQIAGIELDEYMDGCTDGTWQQTGERYFECPVGKGIFYPLVNLKKVDVKVLQKQLSKEKKEQQSLHQQLTLKNKNLDQVKNDNTKLQQEKEKLREEFQRENRKLQEQLARQRTESEEKQRLINSHSQIEQQLRSQLNQLQEQLNRSRAEGGNPGYTQLQVPPQEQDSWNVPRDEVEITGEIGRGGWGAVFKGRFRGQMVAVKKAFKEILKQPYTIRLMKREIQIMASVQHPNLVRFIAAVIDDKVDRGQETPLLVVELLDMDLRRAYETTDLGTNRIPIFRDVAYALHYLHEHQEPIIHRDVSAPNVLLERLQGGTFRAKLSDFGSANKVKDARTAGPGAICYTAPEAFPPVDLRAPVPPQTPNVDVYSYGILLAEVITKTMPTTENRGHLLNEVERKWTLMFDLICSCTKPTPTDRPTMATILGTLNRIPTPRPRQ